MQQVHSVATLSATGPSTAQRLLGTTVLQWKIRLLSEWVREHRHLGGALDVCSNFISFGSVTEATEAATSPGMNVIPILKTIPQCGECAKVFLERSRTGHHKLTTWQIVHAKCAGRFLEDCLSVIWHRKISPDPATG